jgi:O-antigen ligase
MWIVMVAAGWLIGYILSFRGLISSNKVLRLAFFLVLLFVASALLVSIFTDQKYVAFFGETQRRNGFLAYLSLSVIFLATSMFIRIFNIKQLFISTYFIATLSVIYAVLQTSGNDFVKWNNPYNAIISTVGNPNFAGAIMAMMAAIIFGPVLNNEFNKFFRVISLILVLTLLYTIYLSEARQGLISIAIGIGVYTLVWIYQHSKKLGHVFASLGGVVGIFSILGMLQIGPLTSILYKGSVSVRGYYWRAGIKMFTENPITGVGLDRYGAYFKQYREVKYPLTYGFNITSSNAHDLPIQLFATGGILFGLSYLLLTSFIFYRGVVAIKSSQGMNQLLITSIFSAWLAYQAQSIISIDNIGISIWGWLLGGAIVGLSIQSDPSTQNVNLKKKQLGTSSLIQPLVSMGFLIIAIIFISVLYKGENNMYETRQRFNPQAAENRQPLHEYATKTINTPLTDPNYKIMSAAFLIASGFTDEGLKEFEAMAIYDPRNLDNLNYLADYNQQLNRLEVSNKYRLIVAEQDPWNTRNYLLLGRNYKALGNYTEMNRMLSKINSFDQVSNESKAARSELVQP